MDAQQFLAEFGHIASAPEGIAQLRVLILNLAVSGKLTIQNDNEHSALLFEKIAIEHDRLLSKGNFKENKKLRNEEIKQPWPLPSNWQWTRFAELCSFSAGRTPSRKEGKYWNTGDYPWFSIADLIHGQHIVKSSETISQIARDEVFKKPPVPAGTLLMSFKLSIGKLSILGVDAYHNEAIIAIQPFAAILKEYFFKCLSGFELTAGNKAAIKGDTLNQDSLSNILVALPPEEEISRIVAKVDELMALCDKLDAQQQKRSDLQAPARKVVLADLINADTISFPTAWERLDRNIGSLLETPDAIDDFEASLRDLAVRGLLSPATDIKPDIDAIVQACTELQDKYIALKWMRKQKLILVAESTIDFPPNWGVAPFDEVAVIIGGVTKGRDLKGREVISCPYLSVANVQRGFFKLGGIKTIDIPVEEIDKYRVDYGDLMITEGGDWDKVGRTAIWRGGIENCLHQNHVFKARVPSGNLLNEWVELVFNSNIGRNYFAGASKQTTNLASINMTQLRSFPMPIPPFVEQKVILERLAAMTAICKTWRGQRKQAQKLSALLAAASVSSITGVHIDKEEKELKAPKTELISTLRLGVLPNINEQAPLAAILARQNGEMAARDLWQRFGGEIDAFYAQLKLEVSRGWILEPAIAEMREIEAG